MNVKDLKELSKCFKKYELGCLLLHEASQREVAFAQALEMAAQRFACRLEWESIEVEMEAFLRDHYKESWFALNWQRGEAVRNDLFRIRRLYGWLLANVKGDVQARVPLEMPTSGECGGCVVQRLEVMADLIVALKDESMLGVLLCRRLPDGSGGDAGESEKDDCRAVELLALMGGLKRAYPNRRITAMLISAESRADAAGSFATFEEKDGDNVIRLTDKGLSGYGDVDKALWKSIREAKSESCQSCRFADVCKSPMKAYVEKVSMQKAEDRLNYTDEQIKGIRHSEGPLRICAGPGAGKTEALTARIQHLIYAGVKPERILAATFTKKAAKEILSRVHSEQKPTVSTLHALGFQIVRQHECLTGKKKLVSRVDRMQILLQILNQAPMIHGARYWDLDSQDGLLDSLFKDFSIIDGYGWTKFREFFPGKDAVGIFRVKEMYDQKFQSAGYICFEDQIRLAVELLEGHSGVQKKMQGAFDYIMVDEAQDLDAMQVRLVQLLVREPQNNLAVYGDADQSIYGFRGGSNRFMVDFMKRYPEAVDIRLSDNFRSSAEILNAANTLIGHNTERVPFRMRAHAKAEARPTLIRHFHPNRIGAFVQDLMQNGFQLGQIAIIARANKELECMCDMLDQFNIERPETAALRFDRPKTYLHQDYTFQTMLDLLCIYLGHYTDDKVWYRLLTASKTSLEKQDRQKTLYEDYLAKGEIFPFEGEEESRYLSVGERHSGILQAFAKIYRASRFFTLPARLAIWQVADFFIDEAIENQEALEILDERLRERGILTAEELWSHLAAAKKFRDETRLSCHANQEGKIHLLTAHSAKGKEFDVVLVYGADKFERGNMQEDRRLLYVALTRAKKKLFVTEICNGKSSFLQELKENLDVMEGMPYA